MTKRKGLKLLPTGKKIRHNKIRLSFWFEGVFPHFLSLQVDRDDVSSDSFAKRGRKIFIHNRMVLDLKLIKVV